MGGDAFTEKAFINALFFGGLESGKFKPLSGTRQRVGVRMMSLHAFFLLVQPARKIAIHIIGVGSASCSFRQRKGNCQSLRPRDEQQIQHPRFFL